MKVSELTKRDFTRNPLMVVDKSLDKFKDHKIPQIKIDSANEISKMESYKSLRKERITKP
ncbi:MAG: hypothetical protein LW711_06590 [Saprospiraceae bacterium]|jgi:hypothetical protein|nr:hypothetical protein [Saprospiraceae bacterium]